MTTFQYILGTLLIIISLALIAAILGQSAKSKRLGGAIAGGAETFLGKDRGKKIDRVLNRLTAILAIILALLTLTIYVFQDEPTSASDVTSTPAVVETSDDTTSDTDTSDITSEDNENSTANENSEANESSSESAPAESTDESAG